MWFAWRQGRPDAVGSILESMTSAAIAEWQAWLMIDGPLLAGDRQAGVVAAAVANYGGFSQPDEMALPSHFLSSLRDEADLVAGDSDEDQTAEQIDAFFQRLVARQNDARK